MLKKMLMAAAISAVAATSFAGDPAHTAAKQTFELKNGSTVYVFPDGKTAMEGKTGKPERMKEGVVMETKDGQKLIMVGDEVMKLDSLKYISR